jgi:hypothetical protein
MRLRSLTAAAALVCACGGTTDSTPAVQVDTLPNGVTRTLATNPVEPGRWSLVRTRDIQPAADDPAELIDPTDLALAEDGSLLVSDSRPAHIKVFSASGVMVRRFGREGSGPGEFRTAYIAVRGDTLVVQDPQGGRAVILNWRTGTPLGERRSACCYYNPIGLDAAGRAVVRSTQQPPDTSLRHALAFVRLPISGGSADTIFAAERQDAPRTRPWQVRDNGLLRTVVIVPLQARPHFAVDPAGGLVTGWSGDYVLRRTSDGRDTTALFGRVVTAEPVSAAEKIRIVEEQIASRASGRSGADIPEAAYRAAFDPALIPDTRPAYENLVVDGAGRTWVRQAQQDTSRVVLDVFHRDGRWLDAVELDASGWPRSTWELGAWSSSEVAVKLEDDEGRPFVRIYRIVRQ